MLICRYARFAGMSNRTFNSSLGGRASTLFEWLAKDLPES